MIPTQGAVRSFSDKAISMFPIKMRLFQVAWTSSADTNGGADLFTCVTDIDITGWIHEIETDPDGTTAPTAAYDITLINANGRDVAGGALANRSATATEIVKPLVNSIQQKVISHGPLTITITAAGDEKKGELLIYYEPF
jgi:hypothetical protein